MRFALSYVVASSTFSIISLETCLYGNRTRISAISVQEMALPVHELFKDRDVWEFWRETGAFSEAIPRICGHVETLILRYGALYGLVAWLGTDGKLYVVASANLGLGFTYIPLRLLTQSLRPYVDENPRISTPLDSC